MDRRGLTFGAVRRADLKRALDGHRRLRDLGAWTIVGGVLAATAVLTTGTTPQQLRATGEDALVTETAEDPGFSQKQVDSVETVVVDTKTKQATDRRAVKGLTGLAATPEDIPQPAYSAYYRAQAVLKEAKPGCKLSWSLIAAIGKVESDHGRLGGGALDARGVAKPAIYGPALDGKGGRELVKDSDGGSVDKATRFDRAVGPMQFIPSTWRLVGVDANDDGKRDPQDVNDAALGSGVYLCAGGQDVSTRPGQLKAAMTYNNSRSYAQTVLRLAADYEKADPVDLGGAGSSTALKSAARVADSGPAGSVEAKRDRTGKAGAGSKPGLLGKPPATTKPRPPAVSPTKKPTACATARTTARATKTVTAPPSTAPPSTAPPSTVPASTTSASPVATSRATTTTTARPKPPKCPTVQVRVETTVTMAMLAGTEAAAQSAN